MTHFFKESYKTMKKEIPDVKVVYPDPKKDPLYTEPAKRKGRLVRYLHLQTPFALPGFFSPTSIINIEKDGHKEIEMRSLKRGVKVYYKDEEVLIPDPNIAAMVYKK